MSQPQEHLPAPSMLAWFGISAGAAALAWIGSSILVVIAHRDDGAGPAALGVCVAAATLTLVATVVGSRYKEQTHIAEAVAEVKAENLEEHRQIIVAVQQLQLRLARLEANTERLLKLIPEAIKDARWQGRADMLEDTDANAPVIPIGSRRTP